ncbi:hypothetical protein [Allorhizocola rhizosphaerae]|uniref:hypothetical protein n=1 Tax=Allorhizocola rhizosphaerae TaxID=1872709 RepID=UPI000E3C3BC8|nr:hypothetical protein [Allorhizocola rhizosphaerae]
MYARVSSYTAPVSRLDEMAADFEKVQDAVSSMDGFQGAYLLIDRASGKAKTVTLWSSAETLRASVERANQLRQQVTSTTSTTIDSVENYEVASQFGLGG